MRVINLVYQNFGFRVAEAELLQKIIILINVGFSFHLGINLQTIHFILNMDSKMLATANPRE